MVKKRHTDPDVGTRIQRAQRVTARRGAKENLLVSDELIHERRVEAQSENMAESNKEIMIALDRAFDAMIVSMQDPEAKAAISAMMNATPETLRDAAAEYRKHEADMYRVMDEPHEGILRTVLEIMDSWELSVADRLNILRCNRTMYSQWTKDPDLMIISGDTLLRMRYLLRIWEALNTQFPEPEIARAWLRRPNNASAFNDATPLSVIARGKLSDLLQVRQFLDQGDQ